MRKNNTAAQRARVRRKAPLTVSRKELLVDGSDNQFRELVHSALAFAARLQAVRDGYGRMIGLTGIQYSILVSVAHLQGEREVGVNDLADHLGLSATFVTTETKKLAALELLRKEDHGQDRRRVVLTLTDDGWQRLNELSVTQRTINDVHFEPLTRSDFVALHRIMHELTLSTDRALVMLEHVYRLQGKSIGRLPHHLAPGKA